MFLSSCGVKDGNYNANKKIANMKTYAANAEVTVYGLKENSKYVVKQYYKADDKFRVEAIEPEYLKGKVVIYNGKKCTIYHPLIGQTIRIDKDEDDNRFTNIGIIQKGVLSGEKAEYKAVKGWNRVYSS
jgi:outer membrane lipoprotein-sorting protein